MANHAIDNNDDDNAIARVLLWDQNRMGRDGGHLLLNHECFIDGSDCSIDSGAFNGFTARRLTRRKCTDPFSNQLFVVSIQIPDSCLS